MMQDLPLPRRLLPFLHKGTAALQQMHLHAWPNLLAMALIILVPTVIVRQTQGPPG